MPELEDLYREIILDHYRNPRNRGELDSPPAQVAEGFNPLCGDEVKIYLLLEEEVIRDIKVGGQGCSISQSSASMMSSALINRTVEESTQVLRSFKAMMSIHEHDLEGESDGDKFADGEQVPLGDLEALRGVVKFPVRIKCATLCWNTFAQALETGDN